METLAQRSDCGVTSISYSACPDRPGIYEIEIDGVQAQVQEAAARDILNAALSDGSRRYQLRSSGDDPDVAETARIALHSRSQ